MNDKSKAYLMAIEAAKLDFPSAVAGLLQGHKDSLDDVRNQLREAEMAFVRTFALTRADRVSAETKHELNKLIARYLRDKPAHSEYEKEFLKEVNEM